MYKGGVATGNQVSEWNEAYTIEELHSNSRTKRAMATCDYSKNNLIYMYCISYLLCLGD